MVGLVLSSIRTERLIESHVADRQKCDFRVMLKSFLKRVASDLDTCTPDDLQNLLDSCLKITTHIANHPDVRAGLQE